MTDAATSWAEQEAIEKWWNKHKLELKQMVTVERVRLADEVEKLRSQLAGCDDDYLNRIIDLQGQVERLTKQVAQLERMKGIQWRKK